MHEGGGLRLRANKEGPNTCTNPRFYRARGLAERRSGQRFHVTLATPRKTRLPFLLPRNRQRQDHGEVPSDLQRHIPH